MAGDGTVSQQPAPMVWPTPITPASAKIVTRQEAEDAFEKSSLSHLNLVTTQTKYRSLTKPDWERVFARCNEHSLQYVLPYFDCINFAFMLKGLAPAISGVNGVATVIGYDVHHAFNMVLVEQADGSTTLEVVEPQIDGWAALAGTQGKDYAATKGQVLL